MFCLSFADLFNTVYSWWYYYRNLNDIVSGYGIATTDASMCHVGMKVFNLSQYVFKCKNN